MWVRISLQYWGKILPLFERPPPPHLLYKMNNTVKWVWSYCPHLTLMFCLHNRNKGSNAYSYLCFTFPCFLWILLLSPSPFSLSIWHYPSTLVLIELSSCISLTVAALSVWRAFWSEEAFECHLSLSCLWSSAALLYIWMRFYFYWRIWGEL